MKLVNKIRGIADKGVEFNGILGTSKNIHNSKDMEMYNKPPGEEHYRLLAEISMSMEHGLVYDIGTYKGLSALALSSNAKIDIISYDIVYKVDIDRPKNVELRVGNIYNDPMLAKADLIFVDVDPHDGLQEMVIMKYLKDHDFRGVVMFDDIHHYREMEDFWSSIELPKFDLTRVGHWSGTGLVDFS